MVNDLEIYCDGVSYDANSLSYTITEKLNQVPFFEVKLCDVSTSDAHVQHGKWFSIKYNSNYVCPKFFIDEPTKETDLYTHLSGVGWVERKLDNFYAGLAGTYDTGSSKMRVQYSAKTPDEIVGWQLGLYSTGISKGTCLSGVTDVVNVRGENEKMTSFFYGIGTVANTDCFASYSSDLSTSSINIRDRGSDKSATVILHIGGVNQNIDDSKKTVAYSELANILFLNGYGDGINQLQSECFHATSSRTKLTSELSAIATSCVVEDASSLPASGNVWIGCEKCSYASKTGNTLNTLGRSVDFNGNVSKAYIHSINSPVYDAQYTIDVPQTTGDGSSINSNDVKQMSIDVREIIDQSTLDILTEKILLERKGIGSNYDPPEIIVIYPSDYLYVMENIDIGDIVTVTDSDANLSGSYQIVGRKLVYPEMDLPYVELECSNNILSLLNDIKSDADKGIILSNYMQGATNIYALNFSENIDSANAGYLNFYLPDETVAINRLKLNFNMENYRADAKSVTSAPDFTTQTSQFLNSGLAYYKGAFTTTDKVVRDLSFTQTSNCTHNLLIGSSNNYFYNASITTGNRISAITEYKSSEFVRNNSGNFTTGYVTKLPINYSQKQFLIGAFEYDWGSYNSDYFSAQYLPFSTGGFTSTTAMTDITPTNTSTVTALTGSNASALNSYSFNTFTALSNRTFSEATVLAGYTSATWAYPMTLVSAASAAGAKTIDKIVVMASFNNQYTSSTTSFSIPIQRSLNGASWTTIGTLSGTTSAGDTTIKLVEDGAAYGGYYYRLYMASTASYNANRTTGPDLSSIILDVKTYYERVDDLAYGIVKNTSEFTPPGTLKLYVAKAGGSEQLIDTYTGDESNLDITIPSATWEWEPGNWYYLKFDSSDSDNDAFGGRMRIASNLYVQMFLNSR